MEMLMQLLPLIGGGLFGAYTQAQGMKHNAEIELRKLQMGYVEKASERAKKGTGFSKTRMIITWLVVPILLIVAVLPLLIDTNPIYVQEVKETGSQWLFGLIDTRNTEKVWIAIKGAIILPEVGLTIQAILGGVFGASFRRGM